MNGIASNIAFSKRQRQGNSNEVNNEPIPDAHYLLNGSDEQNSPTVVMLAMAKGASAIPCEAGWTPKIPEPEYDRVGSRTYNS